MFVFVLLILLFFLISAYLVLAILPLIWQSIKEHEYFPICMGIFALSVILASTIFLFSFLFYDLYPQIKATCI